MNDAPYGSKEWFLAQGEPEWRTSHNPTHVIGLVGDATFSNDREPQVTAGPSESMHLGIPTVNLCIDHRLANPQHATDGSLGFSASPAAMMKFAADLFHLAHVQWEKQQERELYERLKP